MLRRFLLLVQFSVLLLFALLRYSCAADYINGTVTFVPDGDTLHVRVAGGEVEKLRLYAIDCPEISQPHGRVAQGFTNSLVIGKKVTAIIQDTDRYGRSVCEVFIKGNSLNRMLASKGHAWWYRNYAAEDFDIKRLVDTSQDGDLGLWSNANRIPPWLWRRGVRTPGGSAPIDAARVARVVSPPADATALADDTPIFADDTLPALGDTIAPNLIGSELRAYLKGNYTPQDTLSYRNARKQMFSEIDNYEGKVKLVYSGAPFATMTIPNHQIVNTEHCWPQSRFSDAGVGQHGIRMQSDIHHLFPTYSRINNERGNKPFTEIDDHNTVTWWVSPVPIVHAPEEAIRDEFSESTPAGFEPPELHKGNTARALFYCAVIYADRQGNDWQWYESQVEALKRWHELDPADEIEFERTLRIGNVQANLNPFVVDPTLVERIHREN